MEQENNNKIYGLYAWNKFTCAFETKEEVEKYLCNCGNIVSCYNPNNDSWTTSGEFSILPIDREYIDKFKLYLYEKNCNKE